MAIPTRKPVTRRISVRAIVHALSGKEQDYAAYKFSGRQFFERPQHNPFKGLGLPTMQVELASTVNFDVDLATTVEFQVNK